MTSDKPSRQHVSQSSLVTVLKHSAAVGALRVSGAILWLLLNIIIGRTAGPAGLGAFGISFVSVVLISATCRAGLDNAVVREAAFLCERNNEFTVHRLWKSTITTVFLLSTLFGIIIHIYAEPLSVNIFHAPEVAHTLKPMALAIPFWSVTVLHAHYLRGTGEISKSQLVHGVALQTLSLLLIWLLIPVRGTDAIGEGFLIASVLACIIGLSFRLPTKTGQPENSKRAVSTPSIYRAGINLMPVLLAGLAAQHLPVMLVALLSTVHETGLYHAANRLSNLLAFLMLIISTAAAPRFAHLYASGQLIDLKYLVRRLTVILLGVAAIPWLFLMIYPNSALSLYGQDFTEASTTVRLLTVGQGVNLLCGPVSVLLMMVRDERGIQMVAIGGLLVMVSAGILAIPNHGAAGAGAAAAAGLIASNLIAVFAVKRRLGFWASPIIGFRE